MTAIKYNILYVDDEVNNLHVFRSAFFRFYQIFTAASAKEGMKIMEENEIHLIISDQKMPEITGTEFLAATVAQHPNSMRMILSGYSDIEVIMEAVNKCGIYQYILKPWDRRTLKLIIDNAISKYQLSIDNAKLMADLENSNNALEEKVNQRTESLEQKTKLLEKTNEELLNVNKIKDKLFSIISHDLRGPIGTLTNFVSTLIQYQDAFSPEEITELAQQIQASVINVGDLLKNLLQWSRLQMSTIVVNAKILNLYSLLEKQQKTLQPTAYQKNIELVLENIPKDLLVKADEDMLNLVLRNLIGNSLKFTDKNGKIRLLAQKEGNFVKVSINDSGVGMSGEVRENLFKADQHHTSYGTANEKGTGLGLKLCKEFVEKQEGEIWVESEEGKGSTFIFTIPSAE
ncbi:MAG: hybrid sensor histidine kinase/response regulator [Bacteroidetes bacterium]|nr:MAG: hybrid sensor histidine kinase/response regulator [Bacteroidota bacterium]